MLLWLTTAYFSRKKYFRVAVSLLPCHLNPAQHNTVRVNGATMEYQLQNSAVTQIISHIITETQRYPVTLSR